MVIFERGFGYVAQAGLKLAILQLQSLECWNDRRVPPCLKLSFIPKSFGGLIK
jgi:hypothetical protein